MINIELRKRAINYDLDDSRLIDSAKKYLASRLENNNITLEIDIVSPQYIRELNARYRGKNKATDVLSFPIYHRLEDIKLKRVNLGNIFLNTREIKKHPVLPNKNLTENCVYLVCHGIDHLLGVHHKESGT